MLVYLHEMSMNMEPSILWSKYSMIKSSLTVKESIDSNQFHKSAILKSQIAGYSVSIGVFGACKSDNLINFTIDDIQDYKQYLVIRLKGGKSHKQRVLLLMMRVVPLNIQKHKMLLASVL